MVPFTNEKNREIANCECEGGRENEGERERVWAGVVYYFFPSHRSRRWVKLNAVIQEAGRNVG